MPKLRKFKSFLQTNFYVTTQKTNDKPPQISNFLGYREVQFFILLEVQSFLILAKVISG
jgi:hypothetical protein